MRALGCENLFHQVWCQLDLIYTSAHVLMLIWIILFFIVWEQNKEHKVSHLIINTWVSLMKDLISIPGYVCTSRQSHNSSISQTLPGYDSWSIKFGVLRSIWDDIVHLIKGDSLDDVCFVFSLIGCWLIIIIFSSPGWDESWDFQNKSLSIGLIVTPWPQTTFRAAQLRLCEC